MVSLWLISKWPVETYFEICYSYFVSKSGFYQEKQRKQKQHLKVYYFSYWFSIELVS